MTSRSAICFRLLTALLLLSKGEAAELHGVVRVATDREAKSHHSAQIAVWLKAENSGSEAPSARRAQILQQHKTFSPHILIVPVGTTVDFPNLDPIFHNAFSNFDGQIFDVSLYPPGSSRAVHFDRPGIVRIFCNIHPSMSAIIVVTPSTLSALTAPDGEFRIPNVTPGRYELHFFDERAKPETLAALTRTVTVGENDGSLGVTIISEEGYLPVPHKNKYGREYPVNSGEGTYGSVLK